MSARKVPYRTPGKYPYHGDGKSPCHLQHQKYSERARLLIEEVKALEATGNWDDEIQARIGELDREIEELKNTPSTANPALFLKSGSVLQALDLRVEYDLEGLIASKAVNLLHAPGGTGKTWWALQAGSAIDTGSVFFSRATRKRSTVYIDFENPAEVVAERARTLNIKGMYFWHQRFEPKPPKLDSDGWQAYKRLPPESLLIFDTLRAAHDKDENSSEDMAPIMGRLKVLRDLGFTILVLHHTPRANERASKGSTCITDLADNVLALYRVRRGTYTRIEDDQDISPDALFRLGTGDKSRYMPSEIFMQRATSGLFVPAANPDQARLDALAEFIQQTTHPPSQTEIWEWAKNGLGIGRKPKLLTLLAHGEGLYWKSQMDGKRKIYFDLPL